jgi:pectin methylesterase-like acyl-CoA thioesterase
MRVRFIAFLALTGAVIWLRPSTPEASVLDVCPSGCPYSSIQSAINAAQTGDTITIASATYTENLKILPPVSATTLTLTGAGAPQTIVDGNQLNSVFNIAKGYTVSVTNISFINGNSSIAGGILNDGGLTLTQGHDQ